MKFWHVVVLSLVMFAAGFVAGYAKSPTIRDGMLLGLFSFAVYWFAFFSRFEKGDQCI